MGEEDFSPYIQENIVNLKKQGAEIFIVTCNTAHIYHEQWSRGDGGGVEVSHIVLECVSEVKAQGTLQTLTESYFPIVVDSSVALAKAVLQKQCNNYE